MATITLEQYLESRSLTGSEAIERVANELRLSLPLASLRDAAGLSQAEMAKRLGRTQAAVSKLEGRSDFLMSTLLRYIRALKGYVDISINVNNKSFTIKECADEDGVYLKLARKHFEAVAAQTVKHKRIKAKSHSGPYPHKFYGGSACWVFAKDNVTSNEEVISKIFEMRADVGASAHRSSVVNFAQKAKKYEAQPVAA